jgi:hypothetical protein
VSPRTRPAGAWAAAWSYPIESGNDPGRFVAPDDRDRDDLPGAAGSWIRFDGVPIREGKAVSVDVLVGTDRDGRLVTYGLATSVPMTLDVLRALPLDALRQSAGQILRRWSFVDFPEIRTADRRSPAFLSAVSKVVAEAKAAGVSSVAAVAEAADVSPATAKRYMAAARDHAASEATESMTKPGRIDRPARRKVK